MEIKGICFELMAARFFNFINIFLNLEQIYDSLEV